MSLTNIDEAPEYFKISDSVQHFHTSSKVDVPIEDTQHLKDFFVKPRVYGVRDNADPLNVDTLNNVIYELGIIPLCWPVINDPHFESRTCLPESYYKNNDKERILLAFTENFRQQFIWKYPKRRPLLFEAPNDCGLQKMVCTTIRPTWLLFPEMHTWEGCASFVSDYLNYEPLRKPVLLPERILSPYTVLKRQKGNSFEFATLLASYLLGAKINAYVVFGYATRDFTLGIFNRRSCPDQFDPPKPEPEKVVPHRKYKVNPGSDFRSKHVNNMEARRKEAISKKLRAEQDERDRQIRELEKPPPDELHGWRVHAWVLVLPPKTRADDVKEEESVTEQEEAVDEEGNIIEVAREEETKHEPEKEQEGNEEEEEGKEEEPVEEEGEEVAEEAEEDVQQEEKELSAKMSEEVVVEQPVIDVPFYIEPVTGFRYDIDEENYTKVDSIYNHKNYYVNLQEGQVPESFDVKKRSCWLPLLPELEEDSAKKQFDMPTSWVEKLDITNLEYEERYPGANRVRRFKKQILEKFAPYSTVNGLVRRLSKYGDYAYTVIIMKHEWFERRPDNVTEISYNYETNLIVEYFKRGREDYLKEHRYEMNSPEKCIDCNRTLEFYDKPRFDHLSRMETTSNTFKEEYINREDRLYSREIEFVEFDSEEEDIHRTVIVVGGERANTVSRGDLQSVTEAFHRNPDVPASEDVALKVFSVAASEIRLEYHYEENFVTNSTRIFYKPNLMDTGGVLSYTPDMSSGYEANPNSALPRELKKYELLCRYMREEEAALQQARASEKLLAECVHLRALERTLAAERVKLFDVERNEAAKTGLAAKEAAERDAKERELRADLSPRSAALGLRDFVETQMARQTLLQSRYDKLTATLKEQRLWYLANQYTITASDEAQYFLRRDLMSFELSTLEIQLERQRVLSHTRYEHLARLAQANANSQPADA